MGQTVKLSVFFQVGATPNKAVQLVPLEPEEPPWINSNTHMAMWKVGRCS